MVRRKRNQTAKKKASTPTKAITPQVNAIPEFIEGIPTQRRFKEERQILVKKYYYELWKELQRKRKSKKSWDYINNDYLGVKVYIVRNESDKKTENIVKNHWKSTYAIKHLYEVVKNAKPLGSDVEIDEVGSNTQIKNGYKKMIILYYHFTNPKFDYLNFTVKLTIGVKADKQHVQYSVCKVNIK